MKHARSAAVIAVTALAVAIGGAATADPSDVTVGDDGPAVITGTTVWYSGSWPEDGFMITEAEVYATPPTAQDIEDEAYLNGDALDGQFNIWVGDEVYGLPTCEGGGEVEGGDECSYVVDRTVEDGDVVLTAPTETMSGLEVTVQHRYFAEGLLARVLVAYHNPGTEPITVETTALSDYGSDSRTELVRDASGDDAVTAADRWIVTGDGGAGPDPVVTTHWFGANAVLTPTTTALGTAGPGTDPPPELYRGQTAATFDLTVAPGATVYLAFYGSVTGYVPTAPEKLVEGLAAAPVLDSYPAAVDAAALAAEALSGTSGRAVAGIPAGTVLLNWGVVAAPAAPPATPATGNPTFTG